MASDRQQLILSACKTGDLPQLKSLLHSISAKQSPNVAGRWSNYPRGSAVAPAPADGPPATHILVSTAIEHRQPAILSFLLKTYPWLIFDNPGNPHLAAALETYPHLPTFKVIYQRSPSIVYGAEGNHGRSTLGQACSCSDPAIPNFLLDQGAYTDYPGAPSRRALACALNSDQPLSLIKRLVACGAQFRAFHIVQAMRQSRFDAAEYLFRICDFEETEGKIREEWLRDDAMKVARGRESMVAFVTRLV